MRTIYWSCILITIIGLAASGAWAQVPDRVMVNWEDDDFFVQTTTESSGTRSNVKGTITWDVSDGQATVTISGSYVLLGPEIQLAWDIPPQPFSIIMFAETYTGSNYAMDLNWYGPSAGSKTRIFNEDYEWKILIPGDNRVSVKLYTDEYFMDHDVTFTLNWEEGPRVVPPPIVQRPPFRL